MLQRRLNDLAEENAAWWLRHGVDRECGGFHGTLDRRGDPTAPTDKGLVQQARHLWSVSTWIERRAQTPELCDLADGTYEFLVRHFRDPADGEFLWMVDREGRAVDPMKKLYAEAFAIFALARYGRARGVTEALDQALACFRSIDRRAHDGRHGGYDQSGEALSWIDGLPKGNNTHIHLMEAFTELHDATFDPLVRDRLSEIVDLMVTRFLQPEGHVHQRYALDFTRQGPLVVNYGHDLETTWLLLDAARSLGRSTDRAVVDAARRMGEHSAARGFDEIAGGYFYEGRPGGSVTDFEKVWWTQFEALPGLLWLYRIGGDPAQLVRLERTLEWLEVHRDAEYGEWFWGLLPDGSIGSHGENKGQEWKESYHNLRALIFTADWIGEA
jgi:mannobiose 2-epimerase